MRRWLERIGIGVAGLLCLLGGLGWYVSGLPWRNRCGDAPAAATHGGAAFNSAVATSQPLATGGGRCAHRGRQRGRRGDRRRAHARGRGAGQLGARRRWLRARPRSQDRPRRGTRLSRARAARARRRRAEGGREGEPERAPQRRARGRGARRVAGLLELHRRFGRLAALALWRVPQSPRRAAGVGSGRDYSARCWVRFSALRGDADARRIFMTEPRGCVRFPAGRCASPSSPRPWPRSRDDPDLAGRRASAARWSRSCASKGSRMSAARSRSGARRSSGRW